MYAIDDLDRQLISILRNNGRASVSQIASMAGVTRTTVQNRLTKLQDSGIITGFTVHTHVDLEVDAIRAIMLVELSGKSVSAVVRRLRGLPEVHSLHTTNGAWDLVLELRSASLGEFDRVLNAIRSIDGVMNSETSILLAPA